MEKKEKIEEKEEAVEEVNIATGETEGLRIANDVIAAIANKATTEVPGVYSMSGGISDVFGKKMSKGIRVDTSDDSKTKIDVNIIVEYGVRIPDIAFEIQNRVKKAVESMTGLNVEEINVHVQGVNLPDDKTE